MRFLKYNFLPLSLCVLASFTTLDSKISFAGGDPTIKDQKVKSSKSNIKQHDHSKIYSTKQKNLSSTKTSKVNLAPKSRCCSNIYV